MADAKHTTVGELTGERRRYSRIHIPEQMRDFVGTDSLVIEHVDEGISGSEIAFWSAYYELENKKQKSK